MIYGLFLPYHKSEFYDSSESFYEQLPEYPREFRRYRTYKTKHEQLNAYANTICPASQLFECENKSEVGEKLSELHYKFDDINWLNKNIFPYV